MLTATKDRIVQSAIEVFNADYSAPLQKVADNADVTRRTLHRYFRDREELVTVCEREMEVSCKRAMIAAIRSSEEPLTQLRNMLYAGIDCGAKYSFFYKLHRRKGHIHETRNSDCADYDYIFSSFDQVITQLQKRDIVSGTMSTEWIRILHSGIIEGTVNARQTTDKGAEEIKTLAWTSFTKAIAP